MDESAARDLLQLVGTWEGFEVVGVSEEAGPDGDVFGLPAPRLVLVLQPKADHVKRCSTCGAPVEKIHDVSERQPSSQRLVNSGSGCRANDRAESNAV